MKQNYLRISDEDASLIIKEYDANTDNNLDFDEFSRLVLPSTNSVLKEISINRSNNYYYKKDEPLSHKLMGELTDHLEQELRFLKIRNEMKRKLLQRPDFTKLTYFNLISNNNDKIAIADLVFFLRQHAYMNPRKEELEAILRRVDHEGDQMINYSEFCELVSSNENNISPDEVDERLYQSNSKNEL